MVRVSIRITEYCLDFISKAKNLVRMALHLATYFARLGATLQTLWYERRKQPPSPPWLSSHLVFTVLLPTYFTLMARGAAEGREKGPK